MCLKLCSELEQKLKDVDDYKQNMYNFTKLVITEKESLSDLKEQIKYTDSQQNKTEEYNIEKQKAKLLEEKLNMEKEREMLNQEKVQLEQMRKDVYSIVRWVQSSVFLRQTEKNNLVIHSKDLEINKQNAHHILKELNKEKDQIHKMKMDLRTTKGKIESLVKNLSDEKMQLHTWRQETQVQTDAIRTEKQELKQMRVTMDLERLRLDDEKQRMRKDIIELKAREELVVSRFKVVSDKVKFLIERKIKDINEINKKLEHQTQEIQTICNELTEKQEEVHPRKGPVVESCI
ncbi:protein hook-like [Boleophthalmus pectinirostris]|uniref:protein hook-like n=1 Tax=Boleophthalmus pectinirostris TaxID=150288 RepID=UPI00242B5E70|nr:protein hook-like [Boleophthalmus pectinirostris]